jgi:hypothetical protein
MNGYVTNSLMESADPLQRLPTEAVAELKVLRPLILEKVLKGEL